MLYQQRKNIVLRRCKVLLFTILLVMIVSTIHVLRSSRRPDSHPEQTRHNQGPTSKNVKTILFWNNFFGSKYFENLKGRELFLQSNCVVKTCEIWHRDDPEATMSHDMYDAILFHGIETHKASKYDLPLVRSSKQRYIFFVHESPGLRSDIYDHEYFFNWTATYRTDSDIYAPLISLHLRSITRPVEYQKTEWMEPRFAHLNVTGEVLGRKKLVAWFVSNPTSQSQRHLYVNDLSKHIQVDIYGANSKLKCSRNNERSCDQMLQENYKFYLSFENALCEDYVTEKLNRAFSNNVVPVVYGGADYSKIAPPLSYIDVRDFYNAADLAKYLIFLDENPEEYVKYFWWKKYYDEGTYQAVYCQICEKLHKDTKPKTYSSIKDWWVHPTVCHGPKIHFYHQVNACIGTY